MPKGIGYGKKVPSKGKMKKGKKGGGFASFLKSKKGK